VGQHQMWAAQYYPFDKPRAGSTPAVWAPWAWACHAMGVQMANPDATVACITGEGSIQMCIQELATCKQYHLTPKIIMLNNRFLGMVRQWQQIDYGSRYSESYMDSLPNFELAEAYGHVGMRIEKPGDVDGALRDAFAMKDKLVFMNFITDQSENVWPMVKAGKGSLKCCWVRRTLTCDTLFLSCWKTKPARCRAWWACSRHAATTSKR
jgi:acetolactate synthase-1/2/3 large subunit